MRPISTLASLVTAQAQTRRDVKAMFEDMAAQVAAAVNRASDASGQVTANAERRLMAAVGKIVLGYFVGPDGRNPFAEDGVVPLAPFPALLNIRIASVTRDVVYGAHQWMARNVPGDVRTWLSAHHRSLQETALQEDVSDFLRAFRGLRLFTNPLVIYEPAHTWVDPAGYRLSDRIWQTSIRTRAKIDAMLTDAIRQGRSAIQLQKDLQKFLLPDRLGRRTNRPYGRDASADAMRLARTEVTHAHSFASLVSAQANPYVDGMDWALSAAHPKVDICDQIATIGMSGQRLRPPMPLKGARVPPAHPHCLCHAQPAVSTRPEQVTEQLRTAMRQSSQLGNEGVEPYPTPLAADEFLLGVLGPVLFRFIDRGVKAA